MIPWRSIAILCLALCARAAGGTDSPSLAGVAEFNAAYQAWDAGRFARAAEWFRQASTNQPPSVTNLYWLGAAQFHRLLQLRGRPAAKTNAQAAAEAMEAALTALNAAAKLDPQHAETHALLGTLYGMKIDGNLIRAARFGPRVQTHRDAALKYGPDNPRVRYLLATCEFHTAKKAPAQREALADFLAAEKLFTAEAQRPAGPLEPRWGESTCLTFIGRTYELLGQRTEAMDYYRRALALHPADHQAKAGLERLSERK